jgi:DNA repair photolyase
MHEALPSRPRKGRGAVSNRTGRYEAHTRVAVDDGWSVAEEEAAEVPRRPTRVTAETSRSVIARNNSPDVPFERSINPYRGCEHGCVYCFARPSHAWLGLSPGLDFETRLFAKPNAAALLQKELARPRYQPKVIAFGTNTDPYQPVEREHRITRDLLEVLWTARHPLTIVTKSALVVRDLDILAPMAEAKLARVMISVTTLDRDLARRMEPRASAPARRLEALGTLNRAGVPAGVLAAPMIPALNDSELEAILKAAAAAGAKTAGYLLLRLPLEIKELFEEWLEVHVPDRKAHVLNLIRQTRGGKLYDPAWHRRMTGTGPYAETLAQRFEIACRKHGFMRNDWQLDTTQFVPPRPRSPQLSLF